MKSEQRNAVVILFAFGAALMVLLAVGYRQLPTPAPAVRVLVAVRIVDIDDAFLESIGVNFPGLPAEDETR